MKVFLSWSGDLSKAVAERLGPWLRRVMQELKPFVSSQDIQKGNLWLVELNKELVGSSIGIICLTKENLNSKWLLFEAGALFKELGRSKVCPLLINLTPLELDLPLSSFQVTTFKKDDFFKLIKSIYLVIEQPLLSEIELEQQFNSLWGEIEFDIKQLLNIPREEKNELQELTEELLLPVIYREAYAGDLETIFDWLRIAKLKGVANLEGHLGFVEASLARITGKKQAPASLKQLSIQKNRFSCKAQLELLFFYFAAGYQLNEMTFDQNLIENSPESIRRTSFAILSLCQLREKNEQEAKNLFDKTEPHIIIKDASDYYRAIPMGILCFAFGKSELGEMYFDLIKKTILPNEGYPFISMLSEFDRMFVNTCIGHETIDISETRIRDFRGHAWVMLKYADFMCENKKALQSLVSRTLSWKNPLTERSVTDKLLKFQRKLISYSGRPLTFN